MSPNTGEIIYSDIENLPKGFIEIDESDMTKKQKETMQVSDHDHRSSLGRLRGEFRRQLKLAKQISRANRSKYKRHVGKKQLKKIQEKADK